MSHPTKLKPRPFTKPGLFFESSESPGALRPGLPGDHSPLLVLHSLSRTARAIQMLRRIRAARRPARSYSIQSLNFRG